MVIQYDKAMKVRLEAIACRGIWSDNRAFLQTYTISTPTRIFNTLQHKQEAKPGLDSWM